MADELGSADPDLVATTRARRGDTTDAASRAAAESRRDELTAAGGEWWICGLAGFVDRARELADRYGAHFQPPESLVAKAIRGERYE